MSPLIFLPRKVFWWPLLKEDHIPGHIKVTLGSIQCLNILPRTASFRVEDCPNENKINCTIVVLCSFF